MEQIEKTVYRDLVIDSWLQTELTRLQQEEANDAVHVAGQKLPALTGDSFTNYFGFSKFQALIDGIREKLPADCILFDVQQTKAAAEQEKTSVNNKAKEIKDSLAAYNEPPVRKPHKNVNAVWIYPAIMCIALLEGFFSKPIFDAAGLSNRSATLCSFLLAGILAVFFHSSVRIIARGKTDAARLARALLIISIVGVFFTMVGVQRAEFLTALARENGEGIEYSPWLFTIVSVALSMFAIALPTFLPNEKEKADSANYAAWHTKKAALEQELAAAQKRLKDLDTETAAKMLAAARRYEYGHSLEKKIIATAEITYNSYKKLNISHRTDGIPDCFREPYYHTFTTHFNYKSHE